MGKKKAKSASPQLKAAGDGRPEVEVEPSRCTRPGCGSTERERYYSTQIQPFAGEDAMGRPFTHIVRRWTRCKACGQPRVDRSFENRIETELAEEDLEELVGQAGDAAASAENGEASRKPEPAGSSNAEEGEAGSGPTDAEVDRAADQAEAELGIAGALVDLAEQLGEQFDGAKPSSADSAGKGEPSGNRPKQPGAHRKQQKKPAVKDL